MAFKEPFKPFLSNLLDTILKKALDDGIITTEESVLISQIEVDVKSFEKEIAKYIEKDGGFKSSLKKHRFKDHLISSIKQLALEDGKISKDEEAILTKLEDYFAD